MIRPANQGQFQLLSIDLLTACMRPAEVSSLSLAPNTLLAGSFLGRVSKTVRSFAHCQASLRVADHKATGDFAGVGQSFSELGKGSANGRSR